MDIPYLNKVFLNDHLDYPELIQLLDKGFTSEDLMTPTRHHHRYSNDDTLLLMPSWEKDLDLGVKLISVNPKNSELDYPTINGVYLYNDFKTGIPLAIIEAQALTSIRTAATSVLAAKYLAKKDATVLMMIGTGKLSYTLIQAYTTIFPIEEVMVWGRNLSHAEKVVEHFRAQLNFEIKIRTVDSIEENIGQADIITCATYSTTPLVRGKYLRPGQHVDLIGAYTKTMRETDDEAILKGHVFVDSYEGALQEGGDIVIPLENKAITRDHIKGDLFELCKKQKRGRTAEDQITIFKSVGHGLEDLIAARYFYSQTDQAKNKKEIH